MEQTSLRALLRPNSVAIVGASPKRSTGGRILSNAIASGFSGAIYPINPNYAEIGGTKCYPSLEDLPAVPDCVVVALPVNHVLPAMHEAREVGVRSGIVVAEGFADGDTEQGRERQSELQRLARDGSMAVTGPCCMGVASLRYRFAHSYFSIPSDAAPGGVSLVSQSGGLTNAITELGASRNVLCAAGIPMTREGMARTREEAMAIAEELGYPLVLKVQSPEVPHKSDAGGVYLEAKTREEVRTAYNRIVKNVFTVCPEATIDGVLVQEMVTDGVEVIVGMVHDAQFGPLVTLGLGGIYVEVYKDAACRLPPLDADDVQEMLSELKAAPLLRGMRGRKPRDLDALKACVVRFSDFVLQTSGRFSAVEMNPVMVRPQGGGVLVADALITVSGPRHQGQQ